MVWGAFSWHSLGPLVESMLSLIEAVVAQNPIIKTLYVGVSVILNVFVMCL